MPSPQKPQSQTLRLNKFLAERLGVSRREADELISAGKVTVDDKPAALGNKIDNKSKVLYNGKTVPFATEYLYLAFNKPVGYICSRRAQGDTPTLYELLPKKYQKLKTVGRLDKDSSGLILLTNDGDFAYQMTHPKFRKKKVYEVELDKPLEPLHQQMISDFGVMLPDGPSKFIVVTSAGDRSGKRNPAEHPEAQAAGEKSLAGSAERMRFTVVLHEGRNRQIRRTFAALGYEVTRLHRIEFGKYQLGTLKPGKYQEIQV